MLNYTIIFIYYFCVVNSKHEYIQNYLKNSSIEYLISIIIQKHTTFYY